MMDGRYGDEDPEDDRDWEDVECLDCGDMFESGPPCFYSNCARCRRKFRDSEKARRESVEASNRVVREAMMSEVKP